ncbi:TPA: hypothetical protein ACRGH5_005638, partial [Klebsiella pneumoniae]
TRPYAWQHLLKPMVPGSYDTVSCISSDERLHVFFLHFFSTMFTCFGLSWHYPITVQENIAAPK